MDLVFYFSHEHFFASKSSKINISEKGRNAARCPRFPVDESSPQNVCPMPTVSTSAESAVVQANLFVARQKMYRSESPVAHSKSDFLTSSLLV